MSWIDSIVLTVSPDKPATSPDGPSAIATRIAPPGAEVWMVFGMRLLLAVSALLTLYIGSGVVLTGRWSWLIFAAYTLHSLTLLVIAHYRAGFWHGPAMYWVDLGWYGLMVWASGGASSPFVAFIFFAILAASFRHGFDTGAKLTLGSAIVITAAVFAGRSAVVLHLLLLRATFVLALGYMIAFWGGLAVEQRRRLALLRDVSRLSNPRFGVQHTLDSLMEKILRFYGGTTCVLLTQDGDDWMLTTVQHPNQGGAITRSRVAAAAVEPLLDLEGGAAVLYRGPARLFGPDRAPAVQLASGATAWRAIDPSGCAAIADLLDARSFIAAPLPLRKGSGRLFVTASERLRRNDASFLNHIVQQAFPVIETIELLDRLASEAAFRERQTIARDLHDSTIQPYIGLRHAVAAIRNQAGADNPVTPELERLVDMCSDVVTDMRRFAHQFKSGRQQEPELQVALRRQIDKVRTFYDVDVKLDAQAAPAINDRMAAQVFQIVTEGVNNICKHTRAKQATVTMSEDEGQLAIAIANPPDEGGAPAAFVPVSIAERVQGLGGTLDVEATAQGTRLRIRVPI
ncbi:sensor histidine kinase [Massilia sp. TN1-12]|uniref:sensor histidine kinase n=1 Tax=Massilia paldalensis TaxID=3377675 RepID=UPI00384D5E4D